MDLLSRSLRSKKDLVVVHDGTDGNIVRNAIRVDCCYANDSHGLNEILLRLVKFHVASSDDVQNENLNE